ncbi:MAG: hypothetical protein QOJ10_404, partial [Chloroflexota bacterium]|nr:hypothetical protein [Chloroflexota bacterium]
SAKASSDAGVVTATIVGVAVNTHPTAVDNRAPQHGHP